MSKYLTEAIGAFFLVLTIGFTATADMELAPLAIGAALMVMVYMGGHVSGAHYNPAVTVAVLIRGAMDGKDVVPYILSQCAGAFLAAEMVLVVTGQTFAPAPGAGVGTVSVLICEILFTFALALVILNVATSSKTEGNSYYGLAIGFTVMTGAFAVGGISGGAFNPAVGFGPIVVRAFVGGGTMGDLWFYVVGPVTGAVAAAYVFKIQEGVGADGGAAAQDAQG